VRLYSQNNPPLDNNGRSNDSSSNNEQQLQRPVEITGVSVSPVGFLTLLQSEYYINATTTIPATVAFPIFLTASPPPSFPANNDFDKRGGGGILSSSIFTNNMLDVDQTTVSSMEGLTYLQLLNGVDMANSILPPDALSRAVTYYAFALLDKHKEEGDTELEEEEKEYDDTDEEEEDDNSGSIMIVEDELGLDTTRAAATTTKYEFQEAIEYICTKVKSTLSPTNEEQSYITAGTVQRARTILPNVWLHGVRIEEVDIDDILLDDDRKKNSITSSSSSSSSSSISTIPIRYVWECSVDDGTKMLEVPLFALPQEILKNLASSSSSKQQQLLMQDIEISSDILQDLSSQSNTNYNIATTASFITLSLYLRYTKSSIVTTAARSSYMKPKIVVSNRFLQLLVEEQQKQEQNGASDATRYCWMGDTNDVEDTTTRNINNSMDRIIKDNGLLQYRTMKQISDENRSVFDNGGDGGGVSDISGNTNNNNSKISLTLEQQSKLKLLQSAYKIAFQKEDDGALRKIRIAMDELENEVMMMKQTVTTNNQDNIDSGLSSIRRAMKISNDEETVD
jgi:ribosomal protein L12E/L44/L45/RPP1/RPP2